MSASMKNSIIDDKIGIGAINKYCGKHTVFLNDVYICFLYQNGHIDKKKFVSYYKLCVKNSDEDIEMLLDGLASDVVDVIKNC